MNLLNIPKIDDRSRKDILDAIAKLASSYTPEWRFTENNPDIGSVLALIFADMFDGTVKRFNNVLYKHHIAFLNNLDIGIKPSVPAKGVVCFEQSANFISGVYVPAKTKLLANSGDMTESMVFETQQSVFVNPAAIKSIIYESPKRDTISVLYHSENNNPEDNDLKEQRLRLFDSNFGTNIQSHFFALSHNSVLNVGKDSHIKVTFSVANDDSYKLRELLTFLADDTAVKWVYNSMGEWLNFESVSIKDDAIILSGNHQDITPVEFDGSSGCWIGCQAINLGNIQKLEACDIRVRTERDSIEPEIIYVDDVEQQNSEFSPFGNELELYKECYIACEKAFCKKQANINLSFNLKYSIVEKIPDKIDEHVNWKLIMKRRHEAYQANIEDVVCDNVVWEYWNGLGWARLNISEDQDFIFNASKKGKLNISFKCPDNFSHILINAYETLWIRVRLINAKNIYRNYTRQHVPQISNLQLSYSYDEIGLKPEALYTINNTIAENKTSELWEKKFGSIELFKAADDLSKNAIYFALDKYPEGSPMNIFFNIDGSQRDEIPSLEWEYYDGLGKWKELKISDRTNNLSDPGIVTYIIPNDFKENEMFGISGYWFRALDVDNKYYNISTYPEVSGIYTNAAQILNEDTSEEEVFFIEERIPSFELSLTKQNILELTVMVNEHEVDIHSSSITNLNSVIDRDAYGNISGLWIKWTEVDNFINSEAGDRHYVVDRVNGKIIFGDGIHGMLLPKRSDEAVKVNYTTGGGRRGNLAIGGINRLADAMRFIGNVYNPVSTFGGQDFESVDQAIKRGADIFKHCNRAVTEQDYEALAMEASRSIAKLKCVANVDREGNFTPGRINVAIVLEEYQKGRSLFLSQKDKIQNFLIERSNCTVDKDMIKVIEPVYMRISTKLWLRASINDEIYDMQRTIREKITEFIDPLHGNFGKTGWNIGELPNKVQLNSFIKSLNLSCIIENLIVTVSNKEDSDNIETDIAELSYNPFYLGISGIHDITIIYQ